MQAMLLFLIYSLFFFSMLTPYTCVTSIIFTSKRCQSHDVFVSIKTGAARAAIPAPTNESVELLGKEHSSDQCHMMQEVCQHFSSSSLTIGRGTHSAS